MFISQIGWRLTLITLAGGGGELRYSGGSPQWSWFRARIHCECGFWYRHSLEWELSTIHGWWEVIGEAEWYRVPYQTWLELRGKSYLPCCMKIHEVGFWADGEGDVAVSSWSGWIWREAGTLFGWLVHGNKFFEKFYPVLMRYWWNWCTSITMPVRSHLGQFGSGPALGHLLGMLHMWQCLNASSRSCKDSG